MYSIVFTAGDESQVLAEFATKVAKGGFIGTMWTGGR